VFKRLRIDQVDEIFVSTCAASNNTKDISILNDLVKQASQKTLDDLEAEERWDKSKDTNNEEKSGIKKRIRRRERNLCTFGAQYSP
jgi:hypothetical protein